MPILDPRDGISRRDALAGGSLAALLASVRVSPARAAGDGAAPADLFLSQFAWRADAIPELAIKLTAALSPLRHERHALVVLPAADLTAEPPPRAEALAALGEAAMAGAWYLAAALPVRGDDGAQMIWGAQVIGVIIAPDGSVALEVPKTTPEIFAGMSDHAIAAEAPFPFAVARTPFGQIGLLAGEDMLMPGLVRGMMLAGAELLVNPARGSGAHGPVLADIAQTAAYENWFYTATATPADAGLPVHTGFHDWKGQSVRAQGREAAIPVRLDMEVLRRGRQLVSYDRYMNFPLWLRDGVYGPVFSHLADQQPAPSATASRAERLAEGRARVAGQAARTTPESELLDEYFVQAVQPAPPPPLLTAGPEGDINKAVRDNIRYCLDIAASRARAPGTKLVLFPEFAFSGAGYRTVALALRASVRLPGPELAMIQDFAREHDTFVAGQFLEEDPAFPNRVFNTAFIVDDAGELILKHRKIQCVDIFGALPDTTPGTIFADYTAEYGIEDLYAIADTKLGKIAIMICFEGIFPEITRMLVSKGAELILHSTSEGWGSYRPFWNACRQKRALESSAYLVCSNTARNPADETFWIAYGESCFIDYRGRIRDKIPHSGVHVLDARIDMAELRAARQDLRLNLPIWDSPVTYAAAYSQGKGIPNERWAGKDPFTLPYQGLSMLEEVRERYYASGVYQRPA